MKQGIETEVKYLIDHLPEGLTDKKEIAQTYLVKEEHEEFLKRTFNLSSIDEFKTMRIRKTIKNGSVIYMLNIKTKGAISRMEYEAALTKEQYEMLHSKTILSTIMKNRYLVKKDGFNFEFDEFLSLKEPMFTVEVELDKEQLKEQQPKIENILTSDFKVKFKDVTIDPRYKNVNLEYYFGRK